VSTDLQHSGATPDLVITGARVRLGKDRFVTGIGMTSGRITALGDAAEVLALAGAGTRVVPAAGKLVLPGFQDSHIHAPFAGNNLRHVWLNDLPGRPAYLDTIKAYADAHPEQEWIVGGGWAIADFPDGIPRREDLDAVVPDRPVFLFNRDVHAAWVNTKALEMGGIDRDTPDPWDGRIERDENGDAVGTLQEGAAYSFNDRVVPAPDRFGWEEAILEAQRHLHALGITGWQDAWVIPGTLDAYRSLAADGRLTARVVGSLWWDRYKGLEQIDDFLAQRERASNAHAESGASGFFPTTVKIMTDGVLENYTGALLEPFCDGCGGHTDNHGLTYVDRDELTAAVTALDKHGFQVHMHAIGDRAVRNALDAVEAARTANGGGDQRHHIAHIQLVTQQDIPRFAQLGVVANCQTYWAKSDDQMEVLTLPFLGEERTGAQYPFESIRRTGARLCMGSDWAVTTADPLTQLEVAVTRSDPGNRSLPAFIPSERLPLDESIDAFTAGTAYVNHDDDGGVIALGNRGDLAVLDIDIFEPGFVTADHAPLDDASVIMTVANGRVVHEV
jgi:predicted amidohydrolase YtcJ